MLGQYTSEILPFIYGGPRDGGLQVLAMVMIVIPDTGGLMEAANPQHGVIGQLPAELKAFQVPFVIRDQVLAEQLQGTFLEAQEQVGLHDLVVDLGVLRAAIESAVTPALGRSRNS